MLYKYVEILLSILAGCEESPNVPPVMASLDTETLCGFVPLPVESSTAVTIFGSPVSEKTMRVTVAVDRICRFW